MHLLGSSVIQRIKHTDLNIRYDLYESLPRLKSLLKNRTLHRQHLNALEQVLSDIRPDITIIPDLQEQKFAYRLRAGGLKMIEHHYPKRVWLYDYTAVYHNIKQPSIREKISFNLRFLWGRFLIWQQSQRDRKFDVLVLLTEEDRQAFLDHRNVRVVPNARSLEFEHTSPLTDKVILSVGRCYPQKNLTGLIHIWARIAKDYPDWTLRILGDGYMMGSMKQLVQDYGLEEQVDLRGDTPNVSPHYLSSSIYASTALFEGLPLVLIEAETAGLPLVSYACPCGPRDIITEGQDGFLVELGDEETFAARLRQLIENEELRQRMGQAARSNSERFAVERVMAQWDELFRSLVRRPTK